MSARRQGEQRQVETSASETLYGNQFTLLSQAHLITPKYLEITSTDAAPRFSLKTNDSTDLLLIYPRKFHTRAMLVA